MADVTPGPPDVMADVESVLAWDTIDGKLPSASEMLDLIERFTVHGQCVAAELQAARKKLPQTSEARISADAALSEASGRLNTQPRSAMTSPARRRAQNLARLLQALHRASSKVADETARLAVLNPTKGTS